MRVFAGGSGAARRGVTNNLYLLSLLAAGALVVLSFLLYRGINEPGSKSARELVLYCAAGVRYPVEEIVARYQSRYGTTVTIQYGGSNTLLSQLEVARAGDLFLAADQTYVQLAVRKGLVAETIPLAFQTPLIAVRKGNPKGVFTVEDLLREDVTVALANPEGAAVGKVTQELLAASGHWDRLASHVTARGVFKPTVNEVANDIKLGSIDAGIVWDSTAAQYPELEVVKVEQLDRGSSLMEIGVLTSARDAAAALRFARFVGARNEGLQIFEQHAFKVVPGDVWEERPQITFFAGSVNRRALEPIVVDFEKREGVRVNTVYNGCGILTAQMRTTRDTNDGVFPDAYMACDVYYLEVVRDWFQEAVNVSDTDIVIAVQKGNPKGIRTLQDLARPGVRVAVGQPEQCTIGVLTRRWLDQEGLYDRLLKDNIVTQTATSALLVPSVTTGAADAALAYRTDTLGEPDRIDAVRLESPLAKAIQPFGIARSSDHKHLARRLFQHIARSQSVFEAAGFHFLLDGAEAPPLDAMLDAEFPEIP